MHSKAGELETRRYKASKLTELAAAAATAAAAADSEAMEAVEGVHWFVSPPWEHWEQRGW